MASFIRNIIKIQCAVCGKDLGSFISGGDMGEAPALLPVIFPKEVYIKEAATTVILNGSSMPCMCPECAAAQEEPDDNNKDGT